MNRHEHHPVRRGPGYAASILAVIAGLAITLFCLRTIHDVAQMPAGDGTGMQWVVMTPLALLFFLVGVPALIVGISGMRTPPSPAALEAARRTRNRTLAILFWVNLAGLVLLFVVPVVAGLLLGVE